MGRYIESRHGEHVIYKRLDGIRRSMRKEEIVSNEVVSDETAKLLQPLKTAGNHKGGFINEGWHSIRGHSYLVSVFR